MNVKLASLIIFSLLLVPTIWAQETTPKNTEPLVTDRPGASDASQTVGKGVLQIETGGAYTSFEENGVQNETYTFNTSFLRYGILENIELRLGWSYEESRVNFKQNDSLPSLVTNGFTPLTAGIKVDLVEEKGVIPKVALVGQLLLPFAASNSFRPNNTGANFRFACSNSISEKSSLTYNIGAQWGNDSPEVSYLYTLNYGYAVSENLSLFAELYGDFPENNTANHLWDAGIAYLISPDFQIDVSAGTSITDGQDLFVGGGLSYRILK